MKNLIISLIITLSTLNVHAQHKMSANEYINTYSAIAVKEMKQYKIPASITLAQGILESGYGGSRLAVKANNHFGIKCGSSWKGSRIYHNDDKRGECFRKYRSAESSYKDHSKFLHNNQRYSNLFRLELTDYKGWAHGLKKAGYATNPKYAPLLIELIERLELYKFDDGKYKYKPSYKKNNYKTGGVLAGAIAAARAKKRAKQKEYITTQPTTEQYLTNNNVKYTVAKENENLNTISDRTGVSAKKLMKYNDLFSINLVGEGDKVYLNKKKAKSKEYRYHEVANNENMHDIAQRFGITLKALLKRNPEYKFKQPLTGVHIYLN